jgi:hypothetical protein
MNLVRDKEIIFDREDLENLFILKKFPVFMGCVEDMDAKKDLYEDFIIDISKSTGIPQVRNLIPLNVLYDSEHSSGTIGKIWHDHHKAFADFIQSSANPTRVFEIGGLHGILSKYYSEISTLDSWTILEPNPIPVDDCPAKFISGFFEKSFTADSEFDACVHSHLFEHIYDPKSFVEKLKEFIPEGKDLFFSIPNIKEMLERKYTNAINFEHTFFLSEELAIFLMESHGFTLNKKEKFLDDHSIFFHFTRESLKDEIKLLINDYLTNKQIMIHWYQHHLNEAKMLDEAINEKEREVFLFGAHIFSQTLLNFGLNEKKIQCILDNDKAKHNKRLYGTNLTVRSPSILKDLKNPVIILRAGVYNNEIKQQILEDINDSAVII